MSGNNNAKFLVYQLDLDNEITFDPVNFINVNLDETRRTGFITSGRWQSSKRIGLGASYSYTDAEVLSGAFSGKEIPFVAKHNGLISADFQASDSWLVYGEWLAISERTFAGDFNNAFRQATGLWSGQYQS